MDEGFNVSLWDLRHTGPFGEAVSSAERLNSFLNSGNWKVAAEQELVHHAVLMTECQCLIPPTRVVGERRQKHRQIHLDAYGSSPSHQCTKAIRYERG